MWSRSDWNRFQNKLLLLMAAVTVAGCAGASVNPGINGQPVSNGRPSTIYIYSFAVCAQEVTLNQGFFQKTYRDLSDSNQDLSQVQLGDQTANAMADEIVQRLEALGFVASKVARGT
jgi:hypothetical protein